MLQDLNHTQDMPNKAEIHLWTHRECYVLYQRHLPNGYDYMGRQYLVMDFLSVSTNITCTIVWLDPRIVVLGFRIHEAL